MEKGQLSIEVIIIAGVILAISALILGKFFLYQDSVFNDATVRQIAISEIEKTDKRYSLQRIQTVECEGTLTVSVALIPNLDPIPKSNFESRVSAAFNIPVEFDYSGALLPECSP